ncbi:MAG: hypothetical protein SV377_07385, partial [Halobacteria archaeon]|nr:hypothetical protein [Halobacteria archaeon]
MPLGRYSFSGSIDRRVTVTASLIEGNNDVIEAQDLEFSGIRAEFDAEGDLKSDSTNVGDSLAYVREAAQKTRTELESDSRLEIEVESELPVGAGL